MGVLPTPSDRRSKKDGIAVMDCLRSCGSSISKSKAGGVDAEEQLWRPTKEAAITTAVVVHQVSRTQGQSLQYHILLPYGKLTDEIVHSVTERNHVLPAAREDILENASLSLVKGTSTVPSSNPTRSEIYERRTNA